MQQILLNGKVSLFFNILLVLDLNEALIACLAENVLEGKGVSKSTKDYHLGSPKISYLSNVHDVTDALKRNVHDRNFSISQILL